MEIFPIQPVGISPLKLRESSAQPDVKMSDLAPKTPTSKDQDVFEEALSVFASMTPRRLREIASESFQKDEIDEVTFRELSTELPLQAVDRNGNVADLSTLTDDTHFDYAEYYKTQQSLAEMIGDMDMADSYSKVLDFFSRTS
ncbi:hypothetical protein ASE36_16360 [Rhizobium sp. Root274]|uniref:hypothetical protein n=1 Tax=unclassified Rhizobium TaxID=2613769 RepID=UPI000715B6BA|nr:MULTISPECIES: hypothetical protein [unclassified Rhizobium]KQW28025.1 hypothetical protein ASC71_16395 [Rhizobium sp. Root1240]KRD28309.1 hypothetical protein ASE36_16360 [Rhizobium sp. Root274]